MEENKKIEAQPSTENENVNDQFTTIEQCKAHIEDQDTYIAQLEAKLENANSEAKFFKGYSNRAINKLTFCLKLLKFSGNDVLTAIAEKVDKAYEI